MARRSPPPRGELAIIDRIRERAEQRPRTRALQLGIGDDCAILAPRPGDEIVVTTDMSLEGRHFRRDLHPARAVGHRTLARGLSDLAAMGATPLAAFLSIALPRDLPTRWLDGFLDGLLALADATGTPLAGGDTSESPSPHVLADITVFGAVPRGQAMRRSGAKPGDALFVTGTLGGSAVELRRVLAGKGIASLRGGRHPHLLPQPRLAAGLALRTKATAAIDISDGLSTDLAHLCKASGVSAEIDAAALPLARNATLKDALDGGEDYELLFAAPPNTRIGPTLGGVAITRIGSITRRRENAVTLIEGDRRTALERGGWEHLA